MELVKRKDLRLQAYDYSAPGAYFVTICTRNRKNFFWKNVGASIARPEDISFTNEGEVVRRAVEQIPQKYPAISIEHYVVMPNHLHILLQINTDEDGRALLAPTVVKVVQQLKGYVTKQIGVSLWQKSFYDHVVRTEQDYRDIWEYIDGNPSKWMDDEYYQL